MAKCPVWVSETEISDVIYEMLFLYTSAVI